MNTNLILEVLKALVDEINSKKSELDDSVREKADLFISSVKSTSGRTFSDAPMALQDTGETLVSFLKKEDEILEKKIDYSIYFLAEVMLERAIRTGSIQTGGPEQLLDYVFGHSSKSNNIDVMLKASLGGTVVRVINHDISLINNTLKNVKGSCKEYTDDSTTLLADKEKIVAQKISDFDDKVAKVEGRLGEYITQVKELQGELSFLALGKAFTTFIAEKAGEKKNLFRALVVIALLIVSIPVSVLVKEIVRPDEKIIKSEQLQTGHKNMVATLVPSQEKQLPKSEEARGDEPKAANVQTPTETDRGFLSIFYKLFYLLPITVAEIILIFYFRIILGQFNAVNAQLLQLKMRLSICQFIESYVDFKGDNGQHNLEKFESLIFSNLMPSAEQVPSTFDGLEHLGKAIASLKK